MKRWLSCSLAVGTKYADEGTMAAAMALLRVPRNSVSFRDRAD